MSNVLSVQEAVEQDKVENMTITVGTQRRAVLEAIAFGAFLRDVQRRRRPIQRPRRWRWRQRRQRR
jgi:hypothetical protein